MRVVEWDGHRFLLSSSRWVTPEVIQEHYQCAVCETGMTARVVAGELSAVCPDCGSTEMLPDWVMERQKEDAYTVWWRLPARYRDLFERDLSNAMQVARELYDT